jgi:serine/threonine protein kinase/WD40 repeat protein
MADDQVLSAPTEGLPEGFLAPGQVLGDRYQIRSQLGRGGMGEVWRAFDLKLRVDVALKALRTDLFKSGRRLEMLRQEVRAAREVMSPNVCRIFDLIEIEGRELVSMEYVDGATLLGVLQERGPLDLKEAQDIASQFLAGLEAIHKVGLIHRDIKPENIMITRAGRVVVMDFGLARQEAEGGGSVSGTPAYMAPEQAAGQTLDARADVYSAGVVLAEMVTPDGIKNIQSRQSIWEGVRSEPARVPDVPWAPVLKKAVAKDREGRYNTARTLTRALEDVTLRVEGAEDLHPYPGLASFTEDDAEYFFGREAEVEQMWRKLEGPPRMLGLVGPSGAGKSSFIRAGLFSTAPPTWSFVVSTPGNAAISSLGRVLAREMAGDADMVEKMMDFGDPDVAVEVLSRWRGRTDHAVLVIDQFEELFTQNTDEEQGQFVDLLGRCALEADLHVLLSMRDDFLMRCREHEALAPVLPDLTALLPPTGGALRRAVVQPATKCGYRFEDDELVEEMLSEVDGERGALPLLAFALARLWENRDRETGLLTRQAYRDIGGVGGALAKHAEATIDRVGSDRMAIVRELFRNLVTAEGTRAVRDWAELLSVFEEPQKTSAEEVFRELIDARLLTSYEVREEDTEPTRRVEIIHESLLANWPRLVRWQTQDADGAQLRDQLHQAARTWDGQGRSDDTLWTGAAYREFASWRERYPGGLSGLEEAFAAAMMSFATRRRRRRRFIVGAVIAALLIGLSVVGVFWQRAVRETRRAESQKLLALGQLELQANPSAVVAYSIASLELADTPEARFSALEALWRGPTAQLINEDSTWMAAFSRDGRWLAQSLQGSGSGVRIIRSDGSDTLLARVHETDTILVDAGPGSDAVLTRDRYVPHAALWTVPEGQLVAEVRYNDGELIRGVSWNENRALILASEAGGAIVESVNFDGTRERLGSLHFDVGRIDNNTYNVRTAMDAFSGRWVAFVENNEVWIVEIEDHRLSEPRLLGRHEGALVYLVFDPMGRYLASTVDGELRIRVWDPTGASPPRVLEDPAGKTEGFVANIRFSADGSNFHAAFGEAVQPEGWELGLWLWSVAGDDFRLLRRFDLGKGGPAVWEEVDPVRGHVVRVDWDRMIRIWPFDAPAGAEPLMVGRGENGQQMYPLFDPTGRWIAIPNKEAGLGLWPLGRPYPRVLRHAVQSVSSVAFAPDGSWFASAGGLECVRIWPLEGPIPKPGRVVGRDLVTVRFAVSPDGANLLIGVQKRGGVKGEILVSLENDSRRELPGFKDSGAGVAFSRDGRLAAGASGTFIDSENVIRVWEVASGKELRVLEPDADLHQRDLQFIDDHHILSSAENGLWLWNVETGESELLYEGMVGPFAASADGRKVVLVEWEKWTRAGGRVVLLDLETNAATPLEGHGDNIWAVALDTTGELVATGDGDGVVRVASVSGGDPHLLLGHEDTVYALAFDPRGRWIGSGANDSTARLWPMPDLSKPPLHTLPREELIAKLKTLTNLRVVRDPDSATGWKLTHDPFPGWETVPVW